MLITSDGEKIRNERIIQKYEKRIKRKQRELTKELSKNTKKGLKENNEN